MSACTYVTEDPVWPGYGELEMNCALKEDHAGLHENDTIDGDLVTWDDEGDVWVNGTRI